MSVHRHDATRRAVAALAILAACSGAHAADNAAEVFELPSVDVVGTAPLPGLGTALRDVPANVQIFDNRQFSRLRPLTLTQFLDLNANSVSAASGQGNAFQQSLEFRGFAASPLLGTPQGVSVFQDGVRINEAFGDVVNWDLLPRSAISSVQLLPGTVPAFGLNTLGGALTIYTKSGDQYPGLSFEASGGSFRRRALEFQYGVSHDALDAFATGNFADDDGYAKHSGSRVRQFFAKVGREDERSNIDVSVTLADNTLEGSQTLPVSFLDAPRDPYTYPDINENRLAFVIAKVSRFLGEDQLVDANLYYRRYRNNNLSSNVNDDFGDIDPDTGLVETNPGTNDRATIDETSYGAALQWTLRTKLTGRVHQFAIGASANGGITHFSQAAQPATFAPDRNTIGTGPFVDTTIVALRNSDAAVYASDLITLSDAWSMSVSARYDTARAVIEDRSGQDAALNGTNAFSRLDPAVGVNFNPTPAFTAYASYNEGMRAPTPIELTCADPDAPCKLPNEFLADPPLKKVVSSTIETGARGKWRNLAWSAAVYRTGLRDDLAFIPSGAGATNAGYFRNVGRTRRQGIELGATWRTDPVTVTFRYDAIDARYRSTFDASSPNNSQADAAGGIVVHAGNRIPGIPAQSAKLRVDWSVVPKADLGVSMLAVSSQYPIGDDNNADRGGSLPGYFVVNLDAQYALTPRVTLFATVENLFDRQYANFAQLGSNVFTGPGRSFGPAQGIAPVSEQFHALGSPRAIFVGVRVAFDATPAKH
ncbi:MAG TPA: TonB-dependent receptor [Casimicrobiaceae bacterium]|nr:TonB-dependent receptor [Casimicrobiaceae bacterium]